MLIHTVFDLLAWLSAAAMAWWVGRMGWLARAGHRRRTPLSDPGYFIALALGALAGAVAFGSWNLELAQRFGGHFSWGHSIAGAIAGGIVGVEAFKLATGVRQSTGIGFVAPLCLGIAVGRIGCFLAGLPDYTYGVPTQLPWGVDFGDGIPRHPVQLYESAAMFGFLLLFLVQIAVGRPLFLRQGFYLFVGWYALQRFVWEFLKPYPHIFGPFNLFHLICITLILYSLAMMGRSRGSRSSV